MPNVIPRDQDTHHDSGSGGSHGGGGAGRGGDGPTTHTGGGSGSQAQNPPPKPGGGETKTPTYYKRKGLDARPLFLCAESGAFSNTALPECNLKIPKTART